MPNIKHLSDEELVIEIRSHDRERYAELVRRYQEKLMRYAAYMLHDDQKALDVVQDSFIKAYSNLNGFNMKLKFSSWIYRIVHNEAMNAVKKYRKETPLYPSLDMDSGQDPAEDFDRNETVKMIHSCLEEMPVLYGEPLALYYLEDKSYEEISDILRIPMGTVATRMNRAKALMKKICQRKR